MTAITAYHAHVYFDADTLARARTLREAARDEFGIEMGRVHERAMGPHPDWSYQLAFSPEKFGEVVPWLALNRAGLSVFVHPETGDARRTTPSTPSGWVSSGRWTFRCSGRDCAWGDVGFTAWFPLAP